MRMFSPNSNISRWIQALALSYGSSLMGFCIVLLIAVILGAEGYAQVVIGLAIGGFIMPILSLGGERTFVKDAVSMEKTITVSELANTSYSSRLFMFVAIVPLSLLISRVYAESFHDCMTITVFALWFGITGLNPSTWYDFYDSTKLQNLFVFVERTISLAFVCSVAFNKVISFNALELGVGLLTVRLVSMVLQVVYWFHRFSPTPFRFVLRAPSMDSKGIDLTITTAVLFNAVMTYGTQLIVAKFSSQSEIAAYGLAFQLMNLCFLFQGQALRLVNRSIAEAADSKSNYIRSLKLSAGIIVGGSSVLALIALALSLVFPIFFAGEHFSRASSFTPVLALWVVVAGAGIVLTQHNIVLGQSRFFLRMACIGAIISTLICLSCVGVAGVASAALGLITAHSVVIAAHAIRFRKLLKIRYSASLKSQLE